MVEGAEGLGEAVTGSLAARAFEPHSGEAAGHANSCLNCGTALRGDYCHACGQRGHVHRTIGAWWHDLAHGVLHMDGKTWRTLPMLAWRPGELTRRYVEGERARFVSPMAIFLFSVFLMFAVFTLIGGPFSLDGATQEDRAEARAEFLEERAADLRRLNSLEAELAEARAAGRATRGIEAEIAEQRNDMKIDEQAYLLELRLLGEAEKRESEAKSVLADAEGDDKPIGKFQTRWPRLDAAIEKANENPSLLFYKLQNNAYKFSWALIPISVPFVWLLFLHRSRYRAFKGYDHVVFVTYSIAFMSLGLILLSILGAMGMSEGLVALAMVLVPPIHMYRQLRGAYSLSRWGAAWRTFVLVIFTFITIGLFFILLLALGVLG